MNGAKWRPATTLARSFVQQMTTHVGMEIQTTANTLKSLVGAPGLNLGPDDLKFDLLCFYRIT